MVDSTLNTPIGSETGVGSGHSSAALGPGHANDSGSDVRGVVDPGEADDGVTSGPLGAQRSVRL